MAIGLMLLGIRWLVYFMMLSSEYYCKIIMAMAGEARCIAKYSFNVLRTKFCGADCENNFVGTG
jgi:hypothetical protein